MSTIQPPWVTKYSPPAAWATPYGRIDYPTIGSISRLLTRRWFKLFKTSPIDDRHGVLYNDHEVVGYPIWKHKGWYVYRWQPCITSCQ